MVKLLHTADWQIGMRAAHLGASGVAVRNARLRAAERVMAQARAAQVDFVVVAGDTFENNAVDRVMVQQTADIMAAFGGPVYILPGNHDPAAPGSVWEHRVWREVDRLHVLKQAVPVEIGNGVEILPCPVTDPQSRRDPTAWIPQVRADRIRIGIAHGTVEGVPQDEPSFPIARDAARRCALDYLALGHWHSHAEFTGSDGVVRMAYSGTHEQTKFGERDAGNALPVEIAGPGAAPTITPISTGCLHWVSHDRQVRAEGELAELRGFIEALPDPTSTLLDVKIRGVLFARDASELLRSREIAAARTFLFSRIDESELLPAPSDDSWLQRLPEGAVRDAAIRLRTLADASQNAARPEGASPQIAAQALVELYALAAGVKS